MLCPPLELINLVIEELYHLDPKSVPPMCLVWPHATRFIQETVFRSIKLIADDGHGPGAHIDDLLAKPPHITRLVHHLAIQRSEVEDGPILPVPKADFFSRLPNLTSLSLSFLSFSAAEDLPSLFSALSRCPISSLKLFECDIRLSDMNALLHHLFPHLQRLQLDGIFIDELLGYALQSIQFDPAVVDFDDGYTRLVANPADRAYIHLDELCLHADTGIVDVLMDLYSSRKFSPLASVRKLAIGSDKWTPTFVGRINRLVARATSAFSLECLEIRAESLDEMYGTLPPIEAGKLRTVELHFPRDTGNTVNFLVWHISTLLDLPPTINEIILLVDDLDGFVCNPRSEAWVDLDAALCHPKFETLEKLTISTTTKEFKLETVLPNAYAKFPMAFR